MKKQWKNLAVFLCICVGMTALLALTNAVTAPLIESNQKASANRALLQVMPQGSGFETIDRQAYALPKTVTEVYKETSGIGYVFKLTTAGYSSDMVIMCGVQSDGIVTGAVCLSSNETLGKEKTYGENFTDKEAAAVDAVDVISGATKTTKAYKEAIKDALNAAVILGGGSVDIRTEEEILADELNMALPMGENAFDKLFITEDLDGIDAVYVAQNGAGYVLVSADRFVGVAADGTVVTAEVADAAVFTDAVKILQSTAVQEIDLSAYPALENTVVSAQKTATGHYVIETKGAGYGIKGGNEYHPASDEYIVVRAAISADGKILDCVTVSQAETQGLGDACATEAFYGQFVGKTAQNYTEIDAIGGATMTTDGYKQAIARAFEAFAILSGGDQ